MPRGARQRAEESYGRSQDLSKDYQNNASNLYKTLVPQLQNEAANPEGYSPGDLAALETGSSQAVGGSTAGAVGQGNLTAARTRNAGGFGAALDESAREGGRQLSENTLRIKGANADLKEQQRQTARSALQNIYTNNLQSTLSAMGLGNEALGQWTNAAKATTGAVLGGIGAAGNLLGAGGYAYGQTHPK